MAFNIAQFSGNIRTYGTLQKNRFEVQMTLPSILGINSNTTSRILQFRAEAVTLPGVTLEMNPVHRYGVGPSSFFPTNVNFSDTRITFLDTQTNGIWKTFYSWINQIFDFSGGATGNRSPSYAVEYKKNYVAPTAMITIYDNDGNITTKVVLEDCFPYSLDNTDLSWGHNNDLFTVNVSLRFNRWFELSYGSNVNLMPTQNLFPPTTYLNF
jgi:hypothetical protein